jgi:hypothetical protein
MTNEYFIGYMAFFSLLGLASGCLLYMLGGRQGKWIRRFLGSLIISMDVYTTSVVLGTFNWWLLLIYPVLAIGFSLGYGADILWKKIVKRTIFALAVLSAGLICCFSMGGNAWVVFPCHVGIGLWSVYLGVRNPLQAAAEETFVCALLNLGLIMYPFMVLS